MYCEWSCYTRWMNEYVLCIYLWLGVVGYGWKFCCCVCDVMLSTALCDPTWSLNGGGTPSRKLYLGVRNPLCQTRHRADHRLVWLSFVTFLTWPPLHHCAIDCWWVLSVECVPRLGRLLVLCLSFVFVGWWSVLHWSLRSNVRPAGCSFCCCCCRCCPLSWGSLFCVFFWCCCSWVKCF